MELETIFSRATALIIFLVEKKKKLKFYRCHKVSGLTHSAQPGLLGDPVSELSGVWRLQFLG